MTKQRRDRINNGHLTGGTIRVRSQDFTHDAGGGEGVT